MLFIIFLYNFFLLLLNVLICKSIKEESLIKIRFCMKDMFDRKFYGVILE